MLFYDFYYGKKVLVSIFLFDVATFFNADSKMKPFSPHQKNISLKLVNFNIELKTKLKNSGKVQDFIEI